MGIRKYSRQRECIKDYLMSRKDHPTADMIYRAVREKYPSISLGTVYRNLSLMADEGDILRLSVGDGTDHFDATTEPHYHFRCNRCGAIRDLIHIQPLDSINLLAQAELDGRVEGHDIVFRGVCGDCAGRAGED